MDLISKLLLAAIILPSSIFLAILGTSLFKTKSFEKALNKFEKNPSQGSFIEKYFYWWNWKLQRDFTRHTIKAIGDGGLTWFYRLAGAFFMALSIAGVVSLVAFVVLA